MRSKLGRPRQDNPPKPAFQRKPTSHPRLRTRHNPLTAKRLTGDWGGARSQLEEIGIEIDLSYQAQWQQNFRGGLNTHNAERSTGSYDWEFDFNFNKLGLLPREADFKSGFYMKVKGDYNQSIQDYVGSLSDPNADPAGDDEPIFVRKWWFWNRFLDDRLEIRLGLNQTHKDLFDTSLYANHEDRDFLNQSSFRNPTIPHGVGLGIFAKAEPIENWYVQAAVQDSQARRYRTGFDTAFHGKAWYQAFWETGLTPTFETSKGPMPGKYRIGGWYDPTVRTIFEELEEDEEPRTRGDDVGFYLGLDQMVWKENDDREDEQGLGLFSRFGASHGDINQLNRFWQVGASYRGPLPGRDDDVFGFSWANGMISSQYKRELDARAATERVFEWYYAWRLTPAITISPDLQIITNPGGSKDGRDAIVGGIRLRVVF